MTDSFEMESKILYQMPISRTLCTTGRRYIVISFFASSRISRILFNKAKNGANGKAAANIVTKPYCKTIKKKKKIFKNYFDGIIFLIKTIKKPTHFQVLGKQTSRTPLNEFVILYHLKMNFR